MGNGQRGLAVWKGVFGKMVEWRRTGRRKHEKGEGREGEKWSLLHTVTYPSVNENEKKLIKLLG